MTTRAELLAGEDRHQTAVRRLLAGMGELVVDRRIAERASALRRAGVRMPDALIAATGLVHQLTVLTKNVRDLRKAPGLRVRSP